MAQLKMYRLWNTPVKELTLPEGYSFVHLSPDGTNTHGANAFAEEIS